MVAMFHSPHGLDAGRHEMEYDPVSDNINDMIHDYEHGEDFQNMLWQICQDLRDEIQTVEAQVRIATGCDSWQYPTDGDMKALRGAIEAYLDKPKGKTNDNQTTSTNNSTTHP